MQTKLGSLDPRPTALQGGLRLGDAMCFYAMIKKFLHRTQRPFGYTLEKPNLTHLLIVGDPEAR